MFQDNRLYRFVLIFATASFAYLVVGPLDSYAAGGDLPQHTVVERITKRSFKRARSEGSSGTVKAKAVCCVNLVSDRVLISRNPDQELPIASLTKLITALVVIENEPLDRQIRIPAYVRKTPKAVIGLVPGDIVSVRDLLHGLLMQSGNDCAESLANSFPGGRKAFLKAMNKKAQAIRATRTHFYTPSGLDLKFFHTAEGKRQETVKCNTSTAREVARIARVAFGNSTIRSISLKKHFTMHSKKKKEGYRVSSTNKLLRENFPVTGGKTGFTFKAGHCLATSFSPGRNDILIVVLGSPDHFGDTRLLYRRALKMTRIEKGRARANSKSTEELLDKAG